MKLTMHRSERHWRRRATQLEKELEMARGGLPEPGVSRRIWKPVAHALRLAPGQWAKIRSCEKASQASAMAFAIRDGRYRDLRPAGAFEATARGLDVWVRYVGGVG